MMWFFERMLHRSVCFKGGSGKTVTSDMKAQAEVAARQWNDYQTRYVPFENKFIADVNSRDDTKRLQGMVAADVAQKAGTPQVNPIQGGVTNASTVGKALSAGLTDARAGALDRKAQERSAVVAMGRGQQTEALSGLTDQAITSGLAASHAADVDVAERGALFSTIGSALGAGAATAKNVATTKSSDSSNSPDASTNGGYCGYAPAGQFGAQQKALW